MLLSTNPPSLEALDRILAWEFFTLATAALAISVAAMLLLGPRSRMERGTWGLFAAFLLVVARTWFTTLLGIVHLPPYWGTGVWLLTAALVCMFVRAVCCEFVERLDTSRLCRHRGEGWGDYLIALVAMMAILLVVALGVAFALAGI